MTSSTGWSGLIFFGSPPIRSMASRIAARSTTAGTPVKSWSKTRLGRKAISREGIALGSQAARPRMSSAVTVVPSSLRSRFSSRIFSENGSRAGSSAGGLQGVEPVDLEGVVVDLDRGEGVEGVGHGSSDVAVREGVAVEALRRRGEHAARGGCGSVGGPSADELYINRRRD